VCVETGILVLAYNVKLGLIVGVATESVIEGVVSVTLVVGIYVGVGVTMDVLEAGGLT
jgi:hypothetical protein